MRKAFQIGGLVAGAVLVVFGVVAIVMGVNGRSTVGSELKQQQIVGSSDFSPALYAPVVAKSGVKNLAIPSCDVAGVAVTNGATARCFAEYLQDDALMATHGYFFSQMGIYIAKVRTPKAQLLVGGGTDNAKYAQLDPKTQQPVQNGARNIWVTATALTTALNTSYMASRLALFGIVVGIALLLSGLGFAILAIGGALREPEKAPDVAAGKGTSTAVPVPTV